MSEPRIAGSHGRPLAEITRATASELTAISDSPWLEAQRLVSAASGRTPAQLVARGRNALADEDHSRLAHWVARRQQGEPLAYILGSAGFWNFDLTVSPAVLVPRPDTETLVETALERLPANQPLAVADLGTGSGAIAIALATERPAWRLTATDIDNAALAVARANAADNAPTNICFAAGDWFKAVQGQVFDAVIANPPYVANNDPHLADPALAAEPRHALVAGRDGLAAIETIIGNAPARLRAGGALLLEHAPEQTRPIQAKLRETGFENADTVHDLAGRDRVTVATI